MYWFEYPRLNPRRQSEAMSDQPEFPPEEDSEVHKLQLGRGGPSQPQQVLHQPLTNL